MGNKYTINGATYTNLDEMPQDVREFFETHTADHDGDGVPDYFMSKKKTRWITISIFVIGLGLLVGAFFSIKNTTHFMRNSIVTAGTVVRLDRVEDDGSYMYKPVVSFVSQDGRNVEIHSKVSSSSPRYFEGERVGVRYIPNDPHGGRIDDFASKYMAPLILGVTSLFFIVIPVVIFLNTKKKKHKTHF